MQELQRPTATPSGEPPPGEQADAVERIVELLSELLPEIVDSDRLRSLRQMIRDELAGDRPYFRKRPPMAMLRLQVLEMFNGRNASEVARRLGISRATVYRLLKQPGR
jgi:predicted transcriptional regulator YheO